METETGTASRLYELAVQKYSSDDKKLASYLENLPSDFTLVDRDYLDIVADYVDKGHLPEDLSAKAVLSVGGRTSETGLLLAAMGAEVVIYEERADYAEYAIVVADFFKAPVTVIERSLYDIPGTTQWRNYFDYVVFNGGLHRVSDPGLALRILYDALAEFTGIMLVQSACNEQNGRTCTFGIRTRDSEASNWFIPSVTTASQMCLHMGFKAATAWQTRSGEVKVVCSKREQAEIVGAGLNMGSGGGRESVSDEKGGAVFVVTANSHIYGVLGSKEKARNVAGDLLSDTGIDIKEGDIDIEEWKIGEVIEIDEGPQNTPF